MFYNDFDNTKEHLRMNMSEETTWLWNF